LNKYKIDETLVEENHMPPLFTDDEDRNKRFDGLLRSREREGKIGIFDEQEVQPISIRLAQNETPEEEPSEERHSRQLQLSRRFKVKLKFAPEEWNEKFLEDHREITGNLHLNVKVSSSSIFLHFFDSHCSLYS